MNHLHKQQLRWSWVGLLVAALIVAGNLHATIVTIAPDDVNRLIGPGAGVTFPDTVLHDELFSIHHTGPQETLIFLSNASLLTALQTALGPASSYQINSATLTVGSDADDFAPIPAPTAHLVLQSYTPAQVTWNSRMTGTPWAAGGLLAGTDYAAAIASTATPTPGHTSTERDFTGLGPVVQNWLNNTTPNLGLLFLASSSFGTSIDYTDYQNVVWTLDAEAISAPEPSSVLLLAIGGLLLWSKRHRRP